MVVLDAAVRAVMPMAYRLKYGWEIATGQVTSGAAVAAWCGGRILCVRHSYRPGWAFPGGEVGRRETPVATAARELREEIGINIPEGSLDEVTFPWQGRNPFFLFECRLAEIPDMRIDNREIVRAEFLKPEEIGDPEWRLRLYLHAIARRRAARRALRRVA